jgi:hypothetical protein
MTSIRTYRVPVPADVVMVTDGTPEGTHVLVVVDDSTLAYALHDESMEDESLADRAFTGRRVLALVESDTCAWQRPTGEPCILQRGHSARCRFVSEGAELVANAAGPYTPDSVGETDEAGRMTWKRRR